MVPCRHDAWFGSPVTLEGMPPTALALIAITPTGHKEGGGLISASFVADLRSAEAGQLREDLKLR
jgi:hypothetical protein